MQGTIEQIHKNILFEFSEYNQKIFRNTLDGHRNSQGLLMDKCERI